MVFCPIAKGSCPGRKKCQLWTRGRITNTDSKLLAKRLAQFVLQSTPRERSSNKNHSMISPTLIEEFWKEQGLPNITKVVLIDRYLAKKVTDVEALASQWLTSTAFRRQINSESKEAIKKTIAPHALPHKCPP